MRVEKVEKLNQKRLKIGGISKAESDILDMLTTEFYTPKQIAIKRGTSLQAVYKIINKLRKKGLFSRGMQRVEKSQCGIQPLNQIRLHGLEINIKIIYKSDHYRNMIRKTNSIQMGGDTIRLYQNSIELYCMQSFYGENPQRATSDSIRYLDRLLNRLEHDLKVIIKKDRVNNIKVVKAHYSETNNELARECNNKADKINVYSGQDGKLWFLIDNSFNLHEAETVHPKTAKEDMQEVIQPFFNDMRENRPPTLSEIMKVIREAAETNRETAAGLNVIAAFLQKETEETQIDDGKNRDLGGYIG